MSMPESFEALEGPTLAPSRASQTRSRPPPARCTTDRRSGRRRSTPLPTATPTDGPFRGRSGARGGRRSRRVPRRSARPASRVQSAAFEKARSRDTADSAERSARRADSDDAQRRALGRRVRFAGMTATWRSRAIRLLRVRRPGGDMRRRRRNRVRHRQDGRWVVHGQPEEHRPRERDDARRVPRRPARGCRRRNPSQDHERHCTGLTTRTLG